MHRTILESKNIFRHRISGLHQVHPGIPPGSVVHIYSFRNQTEKWIRCLVSYAIVYQEGMNELQLWHQDANHIQHRMTTNPTRVHRQALTRTGTRKRTNTTPWTTPILILPIIHRKNHRSPHGTTLIPSHPNRFWMWIMAPMRIARDRQR